jgi:hypothetical protein
MNSALGLQRGKDIPDLRTVEKSDNIYMIIRARRIDGFPGLYNGKSQFIIHSAYVHAYIYHIHFVLYTQDT